MVNEMIVSIDGPAGAGKSSISKEVAKKLKLTYIDTGAMYRALTYKAIENNIDIFDEKKLEKTLLESEIELVSDFEEDILKIYLDKKEITNEIRTPAVSQAVSEVSTHKKIREIMVQKQRDIANSRGNVILDGRDIGTVVFPFADVKIFLTASVNERAKRRLMELEEKGLEINLDELIKEADDLMYTVKASGKNRIENKVHSSNKTSANESIKATGNKQLSFFRRLVTPAK